MRNQPPEFANVVLDSLTAHIAVLDKLGCIIGVNQPWRRFAEDNQCKSGNYYVGQNYLGICEQAFERSGDLTALAVARGLNAVLSQQADSFVLEYPCHSPDEERWFIVRITSCAQGGESRVVVSHDNITARKKAELALARTEQTLRKILDTLPVGVWQVDRAGCVVQGNAAGQRIWSGVLQAPLHHVSQFKGLHPHTGRPLAQGEWAVARAVSKCETVIEQEIEIACVDGTSRIILNSAVPLQQADGMISGAIIVDQDITARYHVEEALRRAKQEAEAANRELQEALRREQLAARTDELTGLHNRRHFFDVGAQLFEVAVRYAAPLSAIMLDVDHFKLVNDRLGHHCGDQALRHVAQATLQHVRAADVLARYGGEEFAVLLPECDVTMALALAERIRRDVAAHPLPSEHGDIDVTLSAGVADISPPDDDLEAMMRRADRALYEAKAGGRNRCVIFHPDADARVG